MKKLALFLIAFWCSNAHCASIDKNLLNEMLTTVNRQYITPIDNVKTVTAGLGGLSDLDDGFVVSHGIDRIYIYYNHKISGVVPIPKNTDDIPAWVNSIAKAIENSAQISEKVSLRDFEVPSVDDRGAKALGELDGQLCLADGSGT